MKRILSLSLCLLLALGLAACGGEKDPSEMQTPQYSVGDSGGIAEDAPDAPEDEEEYHTAEEGMKVIRPAMMESGSTAEVITATALTPETVWEQDSVVTYNAFTLPEMAALNDSGSIGYLSIPRIGVGVHVYETDDQMEDMSRGAAHFRSTSAWDGNIGLSAHNATAIGTGAYFRDLYQLQKGDLGYYKTGLGERIYVVTSIKTINQSDWSYLSRITDNRLTMITCVNDNASNRLMVQAVQQ